VQDINDLLKSMVLEDQGGGHISAVNYDSQAPIEKTLRSFTINLTGSPSFAQILNQACGEKVEVSSAGPRTLSGVIMGVERKKEVNGKETVEGVFVNLWCAEGMRSVKLSDVQNVRFLNPVLDSEVKKALEVLAKSHDTQKKAVSLNCMGEGKRTVKVGYVVDNPIWKTTYRLVLDPSGKPYLQGWAIVENTQDEDWNNVRVALVSGRPISFQMDLYQPLSVARPVVEPELFASLRPPTYSGALRQRRVINGVPIGDTNIKDYYGYDGREALVKEELTYNPISGQVSATTILEVKALLETYKRLVKEGKYREAEACALKARELDPESPALDAYVYTARILVNQADVLEGKKGRDDGVFARGLNDAESPGPVAGQRLEPTRCKTRKGLASIMLTKMTEKEREIERRLNEPVTLEFKDTPLKQALDDLRVLKGMNIVIDQAALDKDGVSTDRPLTMRLEGVSLKSALKEMLRPVNLTYIIKDEVLQITTETAARRRAVDRDATTSTELGDFFEYRIAHPVTLPRQKSALLPIVSEEVEGSRVSIYNEATHAKFPLLGLRFKNTTKLHLMQGPITVFDNHSYAGDARILDLQPNEERLLSYAIDLGVEVEPVVHDPYEEIVQVKIVKGMLETTRKLRESKTYTIKNRTEHERSVLVEHPYRPAFRLVSAPKTQERARDVYRFEVLVASGKSGTCYVVEEKEDLGKRTIADIDEDNVRLIVSQQVTSAAVKEALAQARAFKGKLSATQQEIAPKEQRLKEIASDQERLRANLEKVPPTSEAYKRYLKKFDTQESEIEQLQEAVKKLQEQERTQQKSYEKFLAELNVE
jgi:Domain of unknown function (DUF4139)